MKAKQVLPVVLAAWCGCALWALHSLKAQALKIETDDESVEADDNDDDGDADGDDERGSFGAVWSQRDQAYAVGERGAIFHSGDGGRVWVRQQTGVDEDLRAVWGARPGQVWAVGDEGRILHEVAPGVWRAEESGTDADLYAVWGSGADDLWAAGDEGVVLHSSDGGARWQRVDSGTDEDLRAISGAAGGVYVAGENGVLKRLGSRSAAMSTNGGAPAPRG
jgi:photosystem II stability/assembly factor-like uncharacterized protein